MKKIFALLTAVVVLIAVGIIFIVQNDNSADYDTEVCYKDGLIIYNNVRGNICTKNDKGDNETIIHDCSLISAEDYILCKNGDGCYIYDYEGNIYKTVDIENILYGEVHGSSLYYIDADKKVKILNINTGEISDTEINTQKFRISDNVMYYEYDMHFLYLCDLTTMETKKLYAGRYCFFFDINKGYVYLSDYNRNSMISVISPEGVVVENTDIQSLQFSVSDNAMYYIPYVKENELKNFKGKREILTYSFKEKLI